LAYRAGENEPAAQGDEHRLEHAEAEHDRERRPDLLRIAGRERTVHELAQHLRDEQRDDARDEGGEHSERDAGQGGLGVGVETDDGGEGAPALIAVTGGGR
jgi:hypothetical protein